MKEATFLNWSKAFFKKRNLCLVIYRSHFVNHQPRGTANLLPSLKRDANKVLIDAVLACLEFPPWSFFGGKTQMEADWGLTVLWPHFTQNFIIFSRGRAGGEIYRVIRIHYSAIADTKTKVGSQKGRGQSYGLNNKLMRRICAHWGKWFCLLFWKRIRDCKQLKTLSLAM